MFCGWSLTQLDCCGGWTYTSINPAFKIPPKGKSATCFSTLFVIEVECTEVQSKKVRGFIIAVYKQLRWCREEEGERERAKRAMKLNTSFGGVG